jgi:hypothetical protein
LKPKIIIPTSQRPTLLFRALKSIVDDLQAENGEYDIIVIDDSPDEENQRANEKVVFELLDKHPGALNYVGTAERSYLRQLLSDSKTISPLDFCLSHGCGSTPVGYAGRNRNYGLLLNIEEKVVSFDDDTVCRFQQRNSGDPPTNFNSEVPLFLSFGDKKRFINYCHPVSVDIIKQFSAILSSPSRNTNCPGSVRIAMTGIYGGRWFSNPHANLTVPHLLQRDTWRGQKEYDFARRTPYALLLTLKTIYTSSSFFVTTCYGYDSSEILPPFFPGIRSDDAVWAWLVRRLYPDSPICHLPIAIEHDRSLKRTFIDEDFKSIVPSSSEILLLLLNHISLDIKELPPVNVLCSLGESLMCLHSLPLSNRRELLSELYIQSLGRRIGEFQQRLEESGGKPRFWAKDVREHIDLLRKEALSAKPWWPAEFRSLKDSKESEDDFGSYIGHCGELLCAWPEIWERAVALKAAGELPL